jgi:hypothetical protein
MRSYLKARTNKLKNRTTIQWIKTIEIRIIQIIQHNEKKTTDKQTSPWQPPKETNQRGVVFVASFLVFCFCVEERIALQFINLNSFSFSDDFRCFFLQLSNVTKPSLCWTHPKRYPREWPWWCLSKIRKVSVLLFRCAYIMWLLLPKVSLK